MNKSEQHLATMAQVILLHKNIGELYISNPYSCTVKLDLCKPEVQSAGLLVCLFWVFLSSRTHTLKLACYLFSKQIFMNFKQMHQFAGRLFATVFEC